jgi:hypothetical protein
MSISGWRRKFSLQEITGQVMRNLQTSPDHIFQATSILFKHICVIICGRPCVLEITGYLHNNVTAPTLRQMNNFSIFLSYGKWNTHT